MIKWDQPEFETVLGIEDFKLSENVLDQDLRTWVGEKQHEAVA